MSDTGSEALDYIFTCQDRYPPYAALGGMRCLLFVRNELHKNEYKERLANLRKHSEISKRMTGCMLDLELPEPFYMIADLRQAMNDPPSLSKPSEESQEQTTDQLALNRNFVNGLYLNQLSPTIANLVEQFYDLIARAGFSHNVPVSDYQKQAQISLKWHDKSQYVNLIQNHALRQHLPDHVPTAMISSGQLKGMKWEKLLNIVKNQIGSDDFEAFYVKSAMDADGEANTIVTQTNLAAQFNELTDELENKVTQMGRSKGDVVLLVQPRIERNDNMDAAPSSVGLTYRINDTNRFERVVVCGHVYDDVERKTFIGCYLSDELTNNVLDQIGEKKIHRLLRLFAEQGYRGPINFDAVKNNQGQYVFIYDCNPRLGGSFPNLILRHALKQAGLEAETLLNVGYRGRFVYPDFEAKLKEFEGLHLLYTQEHQSGVFFVPSLVRPNSFDPVLINMNMHEMRELISSRALNRLSDPDQLDLKGVYW